MKVRLPGVKHIPVSGDYIRLDALLKFPYGGNGVFAFAIDFEAIAKLF